MAEPLSCASIAKRLASCNRSARDRAVRSLSSFLPSSSSSSISDADLLKLWKGLFYCFWHCDKLPAQADLAGRFAGILSSSGAVGDPSLAVRFFDSFLVTIRREWSGIDFLRLDKFYLLNRRFLRHLFLLLKSRSWDPNLCIRFVSILSERSLLAADKFPAQGVNYHIAESFLDELKEFLPVMPETLDLLLKPFFDVMEKSADKVLVNKIKVNCFDRLLENGKELLRMEKDEEQLEPGSDVENFGKIALVMNFSKKFFDMASAPDTVQGNRKVLFGLHDCFLKLEKVLEKSGVQVSIENVENGSLENGPETMVSENGEKLDEKLPKKTKKSKKALDDSEKKSKKKAKKTLDGSEKDSMINKKKKKKKKALDLVADDSAAAPSVDPSSNDEEGNGDGDELEIPDTITFDEIVISNLQKQFEKAAAEAGMGNGSLNSVLATPVNGAVVKKRKRAKSEDRQAILDGDNVDGRSTSGKNKDNSVKKVRFSMKSNLVWKPHSPMPPQSLRLPPSATPRGSALKKGVLPGPIKETPPGAKKSKLKASSAKKTRKGSKSPSSAVKRLRKLQSMSV
ncbi:uncharacterized protein [Typha latifolia]|uniref:uncharacterized protein n=1 Tax=Typha latifolia TaxID=4733 RepID=UPI003C2E8D56